MGGILAGTCGWTDPALVRSGWHPAGRRDAEGRLRIRDGASDSLQSPPFPTTHVGVSSAAPKETSKRSHQMVRLRKLAGSTSSGTV